METGGSPAVRWVGRREGETQPQTWGRIRLSTTTTGTHTLWSTRKRTYTHTHTSTNTPYTTDLSNFSILCWASFTAVLGYMCIGGILPYHLPSSLSLLNLGSLSKNGRGPRPVAMMKARERNPGAQISSDPAPALASQRPLRAGSQLLPSAVIYWRESVINQPVSPRAAIFPSFPAP